MSAPDFGQTLIIFKLTLMPNLWSTASLESWLGWSHNTRGRKIGQVCDPSGGLLLQRERESPSLKSHLARPCVQHPENRTPPPHLPHLPPTAPHLNHFLFHLRQIQSNHSSHSSGRALFTCFCGSLKGNGWGVNWLSKSELLGGLDTRREHNREPGMSWLEQISRTEMGKRAAIGATQSLSQFSPRDCLAEK